MSQQQKDYDEMIAAGQSPAIADILSSRQCPGLQTDKRFLQGKPGNGFYSHQLQRWVNDRADVKRICIEKNWDCEGSVTNKSTFDTPRDDETPYRVADEIVHDACLDVLEEHPTALLDDHDLITKTRERLTGDAND